MARFGWFLDLACNDGDDDGIDEKKAGDHVIAGVVGGFIGMGPGRMSVNIMSP